MIAHYQRFVQPADGRVILAHRRVDGSYVERTDVAVGRGRLHLPDDSSGLCCATGGSICIAKSAEREHRPSAHPHRVVRSSERFLGPPKRGKNKDQFIVDPKLIRKENERLLKHLHGFSRVPRDAQRVSHLNAGCKRERVGLRGCARLCNRVLMLGDC